MILSDFDPLSVQKVISLKSVHLVSVVDIFDRSQVLEL